MKLMLLRVLCVALFMLVWGVGVVLAQHEMRMPLDGVIARVNGEAILLSELKETALDLNVDLGAVESYRLEDEGFRRAISYLVDERLLEQLAKREQIAADQTQVAREVESQIQTLRARVGGERELKQFLEDRYLTLDSLREQLRRREERRSMTTGVVIKRVQLESGELHAFERERKAEGKSTQMWRLAQILFKCSPEQQNTKRGEAIEELALRVASELAANPEDFVDYAVRYSDDPVVNETGGYLGWLSPEELQAPLKRGLERIELGQISKPIRTEKGFHVIYKMEERTARDLFFAELYDRERATLIERLRDEATIRLYEIESLMIRKNDMPTTSTQSAAESE